MNAWSDWIGRWLEWTDGIPSPPIFRLWSGISAVAAALERRVWAQTAMEPLYPNLYVLLVAPPGIGKTQVVKRAVDLWRGTKKLKTAPDNMTKPTLIDAISEASQKFITPTGGLIDYHSLIIHAGELGVFLSEHDLSFLSVLNHMYDNPSDYSETRRASGLNRNIINPQINLLAGTQPGFMGSVLPEEAWSMGTTSRLLMVYSTTPQRVKYFTEDGETIPDRTALQKDLQSSLTFLSGLYGMVKWRREAVQLFNSWEDQGCPPVPEHSKLQHYLTRRPVHVIKLSMISAVSRTGELIIEQEDVIRAQEWLFDAERLMPDVFRDMQGRSDRQVIDELHHFLWSLYAKEKKPVHERALYNFLLSKIPHDRVGKLLEAAEKANIIQRQGVCYTPKAKHEHGVE